MFGLGVKESIAVVITFMLAILMGFVISSIIDGATSLVHDIHQIAENNTKYSCITLK